ncbi:MAG TPA: cation diffusion facilitator family transporter [Thermoanaerobaculia bacterium]|nr:cation diffusion facilitator family transporter [Thermoanaerobaculia bacterium]
MTNLTRYAWLSIAAAIVTIAMKAAAFAMTGSVGLLSDALESLVNLVAAIVALAMLMLASRPPDEQYAYGYTKAEYFASGVEGALIFLAAVSICWTAVNRLLHPRALEKLGFGLLISIVASGVNFAVARVLLRAGRRYHSITLEADAKHLMTDVWTSGGVVAGVGLVALTGWVPLDPLVAIAVAVNIIWAGIQLVRRSAGGLLDTAIPAHERRLVHEVLDHYIAGGIDFHAVRTRQAGPRYFVEMHVLVPGAWSVQRGHDLAEEIEGKVREVLPRANVFTHIEPREDPVSHQDVELRGGR